MAFSVMYSICKWPKLGIKRSQSVMSVNCQYEIIRQHKQLIQVKIYLLYDI
jgi:hypothetical protein